jgi:hypothetical protein
VSVAFEGVCKMYVGLLTGVNSTYGSRNDFGKLTSLDYGSFGLPLFAKKTSDQVNSSFVIVGIIFIFHFFNLFAKIIVYVLTGLVQFC